MSGNEAGFATIPTVKSSLIEDGKPAKPRKRHSKIPQAERRMQILALQTLGLNQCQIAEKLGVDRSTISKDLSEMQPAEENLRGLLGDLQDELAKLQNPQKIAENYVALAERANNESVRLGSQDRILELRGVISDRERLRSKTHDQPTSQPLFVLPAGASLTVNVDARKVTQSGDDTSAGDRSGGE